MHKLASIGLLTLALLSSAMAGEINQRDAGPVYELVKMNAVNAIFEDAVVKFNITGALEYGVNKNEYINPDELIRMLNQNSCKPKVTIVSKTNNNNLNLVLNYVCEGHQAKSYASTCVQILFGIIFGAICLSGFIVVLRARKPVNVGGTKTLVWRTWRLPLRLSSGLDHKTPIPQRDQVESKDSIDANEGVISAKNDYI